MAASDKPTAVHFTLIFFVMLSLILLVLTYLSYRDASTLAVDLQTTQGELADANTGITNHLQDIDSLRSLMGYEYNEVGGPEEPGSVIGELTKDLGVLGRDLQPSPGSTVPTVAATLQGMRTRIDELEVEMDSARTALQKEQDAMLALRAQYQEQFQELQQSQTGSESSLQKTITEREEIVQAKDQQLNELRNRNTRIQQDQANMRDQMDAMREDFDLQVTELVKFNTKLRSDLDEIKEVSFEVPDGEIRRVDHATRTVWINLGKADGLREQTSFSVYDQDHHGVGRGPEDIKGRVEVTRILGPHLSQARMLDANLHRPMAEHDVVYSPIWTAGLVERFALVGEIDVEGDGLSDRDQLHDILRQAGAEIAVEIDDEGYRHPENATITPDVKFLVLGSIPDPAEYPSDSPHRDRIDRLREEQKHLIDRAQQQGVRIMNLNTFLEFMGYKPTQRLFLPGESRRYTLQGGDENRNSATLDNEISSSRTSELFRRPLDRTGKPVERGYRNYER